MLQNDETVEICCNGSIDYWMHMVNYANMCNCCEFVKVFSHVTLQPLYELSQCVYRSV